MLLAGGRGPLAVGTPPCLQGCSILGLCVRCCHAGGEQKGVPSHSAADSAGCLQSGALSSGPTCPWRAVKTSISEEKSALLFLSSRIPPELEIELHLLHGSVARRPYISFSFFLYYDIPDLGWTFSHGSIWGPSGVFSPLTLSSQD